LIRQANKTDKGLNVFDYYKIYFDSNS